MRAERTEVWEKLFCTASVEQLQAGFALFNEDFVLLRCNRVYADFISRHTPYTPEQALGMSHFDYKPGSAQYSAAWFRHVRDSGQADTCYDFELRVLRDGIYVLSFWDVHLSPIVDQTGRMVGSVMCCLDVTERHALKEALRENEGMLAAHRHSIEDMEAAIRVLLTLREKDKGQLEQQLFTNFEQTLYPWLERLKGTRLSAEQRICVEMIESNLADLTSSFVPGMRSRIKGLTPAEIHVAQLVRAGKTSKEIASLLMVSKECVDFHRNNLRKKLGLNKQKVSLRSHLCSF
jgi:PAS domain S-box-containing protein